MRSDDDEQRSGLAAAAVAPPSSPPARRRRPGATGSKRPQTRFCRRRRSPASSTGRSPARSRRSSRARSSVIGCSNASSPSSPPAASWSASRPLRWRALGRSRSPTASWRATRRNVLLRHVASSPELRDAIARQTTGLADEVVGGVRASAAAARRPGRADRAAPRADGARRCMRGIATRALALATDAAVVTVLFMAATGIVSLVASLVGGLRPEWLVGVLLASGWALIAGTYFVLFWSAAGQTPGMRLLRLRVLGPVGRPTLDRPVDRARGRARPGDRAPVRRLPPGALHRAATRAPGPAGGNDRRVRRRFQQ